MEELRRFEWKIIRNIAKLWNWNWVKLNRIDETWWQQSSKKNQQRSGRDIRVKSKQCKKHIETVKLKWFGHLERNHELKSKLEKCKIGLPNA